MQKIHHKYRGFWLMVVLLMLVIGGRHWQLIQAPNAYFLGNSTDGFRSYTAAYYHILHDSTYHHFEGMNYPYGDRVDFTDNLPLFTNILKFIHHNFIDLSAHLAVIWNSWMLFALLLSGIFIFLIFRELDLPLWYTIPAALGITFLSPQIVRYWSHYGLAQPFTVPLVIYLCLLFERKRSWALSITIAVFLWVIFKFHLYLWAMSVMVIGGYHFFRIISDFSKKNIQFRVPHLVIQILLPSIFLIITSLVADAISDRSSNPWGFFKYRAFWQGLVLPLDLPHGPWLSKVFDIKPELKVENKAYMGLVTLVFFVMFLLKIIFRRSVLFSQNIPPHQAKSEAFFWTGSVILLFSLGIPFIITGFENLLHYTGWVKQFRSIGRFAWASYYIFGILAFYSFFYWIASIKTKHLRIFFYSLILLVVCIEAGLSFFHQHKYHHIYPHPRDKKDYREADNPWLKTIDFSKYQAILPIPYFHIGSENIWIQAKGPVMYRSLWASVQTGLPILSGFMGRTSLSQTLHFVALVKEPYRVPRILNDMPNDKSILLFLSKTNYNPDPYPFKHLIKNLTPIYDDEKITLYELSVAKIIQRVNQVRDAAFIEQSSSVLYNFDEFSSKDSIRNFIHRSFNHLSSEKAVFGKGTFRGAGKNHHILFEGSLPAQSDSINYALSMWIFLNEDLHPRINAVVEEFNLSTGEKIQTKGIRLSDHIRCIDGDWGMVETSFKLKHEDSGVRIIVLNPDLNNNPLFVDELQIRPTTARLFKSEKDFLWLNNRRYSR